MDVNTSLLDRIRLAIDREMDLNTHYGARIVEQTGVVRDRAITEGLCRRDLEAAGGQPVRRRLSTATGPGDGERRDTGAALYEQEQAEFAAGRQAVMERDMRGLAQQADAAGYDANTAVGDFVRQATRPDLNRFEAALAGAVAAREAAEADLAALERQRSHHGRRCGQLRLTLREAESWLTQHGLSQRAAA
jgi:hypothetical protein